MIKWQQTSMRKLESRPKMNMGWINQINRATFQGKI